MIKLTKKLKFKNYSQEELNNTFIKACKIGNLSMVRYLLTSPELKQHADIHAIEDSGFQWACEKGHLHIVQYLLTSPELTEYADMHSWSDVCFRVACANNHLKIVKYLLTSPELKSHANIHAMNDGGFLWACEQDCLDVIPYLLSFNGEQYIDFQKTKYNLDWAMQDERTRFVKAFSGIFNTKKMKKKHKIVQSMVTSLMHNDMLEYFSNIEKIKKYCNEHGIDEQKWILTPEHNDTYIPEENLLL